MQQDCTKSYVKFQKFSGDTTPDPLRQGFAPRFPGKGRDGKGRDKNRKKKGRREGKEGGMEGKGYAITLDKIPDTPATVCQDFFELTAIRTDGAGTVEDRRNKLQPSAIVNTWRPDYGANYGSIGCSPDHPPSTEADPGVQFQLPGLL